MRTRRIGGLMSIGLMAAVTVVGCGSSGSSSAKFCDLAERANAASDDLDGAFTDGDPDGLKDAMNDALDEFDAAKEAAPKEIQDDIEIVSDAQNELFDILKANDFDLEAAVADADFEKLTADEDIQDASDNLEEFLSDECGIESSDSSSSSDDTATDDTAAEDTAADDTATEVLDETVVDATVAVDTTVVDTSSGSIELTSEIGGTTVGSTDSLTGVYAALLTNSTDQPASNLSIDFTLLDDAGTVVGTSSGYVDLILPGETRAVTGSTSVTAPASRIEASYSGDVGLPYGTEESTLPVGEFGFSGGQLTSDEYSTAVLGLLTSTYPVSFSNVDVVVVFRDAAGTIVAGGEDFATIQANGQVGVNPSVYWAVPNVATFEVYAAYSVYDLTD